MKVLCVANQKGGVGKSTLTVHLAYAALEAGKKVLVVDMDVQASTSLTFEAEEKNGFALVASELYKPALPHGANPEALTDNLSIIRADIGLLEIDKAENQVIKRPGELLRSIKQEFDICILDTPPLLGVRLMASLAASDYVITPVSVGLYDLAGLEDLINTIHVIRTQGFNSKLKHVGILPIKTNPRSREQLETLAALEELYGDNFYKEGLPERAAVRHAIAARVPVWHSTAGSSHLKAAKEWRAACASVLSKVI